MQDKINNSLKLIDNQLLDCKNPVLMTSFGKDSLVLLDLILKVDKTIPCIFHREAFKPEKYKFANKIIEKYDLTVYDFAPIKSAVQEIKLESGEVEVEIQNFYSMGEYSYTCPTGIIESDKQDCLCGLDILCKPKGINEFKWDLVFIGHKSSDSDVFYKSLELSGYTAKPAINSPLLSFPLKDWTDSDIWNYIDSNNLEWDCRRYDRANKDGFRGQFKNVSTNPDYFEACTRCISKFTDKNVLCPKTGLIINNISDKVLYLEESPKFNYFGENQNV